MSNQHECPYCGEEFEEELEKGIHISEEHTDDSESIPSKKRGGDDKNIIEDWDRES